MNEGPNSLLSSLIAFLQPNATTCRARSHACSFNLYTDSWAMPWVDSLSLRFSNSTHALGQSPEFDSSVTERSTNNILSAYALQPVSGLSRCKGRVLHGAPSLYALVQQVLDRPKQLVPLYSGTQNFNSSVCAES